MDFNYSLGVAKKFSLRDFHFSAGAFCLKESIGLEKFVQSYQARDESIIFDLLAN